MTEGSTGSTPKDWAGGPSIRISKTRISTKSGGVSYDLGVRTYPKNLHRIQRIPKAKKCAEEDERKRCNAGAKLES